VVVERLLRRRQRNVMSDIIDGTIGTRPLGDVLAANSSLLAPKSRFDQISTGLPGCIEYALADLLTGIRCRSCAQDVFDVNTEDVTTFVVCKATMEGTDSSVRIFLSRNSLLRVSSVLFGGLEDGNFGRRDRAFGTLDRRVAERLFIGVCRALGATLGGDSVTQFGVPEVITNPTLADLSLPAGEAFRINVELLLGSLVAPMMVLMPRTTKPDGTETADSKLIEPRNEVGRARRWVSGGLSRTPIQLVAFIEACPLTFAEVNGLRVGDTIALVGDSASRVRLESAGEALFSGTIGRQDGVLAVHIDMDIDHDGDRHAEFNRPPKGVHQ
jgi:flagellar motor switch protein FliM